MKFAASIIALYAVAALAGAAEPGDDVEALDDVELLDDLELFNTTAIDDDDFDDEDLGDDVFTLEKRRGCTGHRKTTDVCTGKFLAKMPSRHNWYVRNKKLLFSFPFFPFFIFRLFLHVLVS